MKRFKLILAILLTLAMMLSCVGTAFAAEGTARNGLTKKTEISQLFKDKNASKKDALKGFQSENFQKNNTYRYADDEIVRAIVILDGKCEAEVAEVNSVMALNHRATLVNQHQKVYRAMAGIKYELKFEYTRLLNGFSCDVAYGDLEAIAAIDGVKAVHIANTYATPVLEPVEEPKMGWSNLMTYNDYMVSEGWDGSGIVVAVLDTGLNTTHEAFQDFGGLAAANATLTEEDIAAAELWGQGVYLSPKVPYAFDYADWDADVTDHNGHGTHVSGIAVGYAAEEAEEGGTNVKFVGASPAAQLLSMKIFSDTSGGTSSDIYFFALEDAYALGADVINLSIGLRNGFTYDHELETEIFGNIYKRLNEAGIIVSIAGGNEYSMADFAASYNGYTGYIGPEYTDYGTIASPSTYDYVVSVGSVENGGFPYEGLVFDDFNNQLFIDSCEDGVHGWVQNFAEQTLDYVFVVDASGNLSMGYPEDYENVDVTGKVAIVIRGDLSFEEKVENAANAGAIACMVVNTNPGEGIRMSIETFEIPAVSLYYEALNGLSYEGTVYTPTEPIDIANFTAYLPSDFSNWGTSPNLTLDPSISSIGGYVYSSEIGADDSYAVYSGTSMASPNMAGSFANLLSAIYEKYPDMPKAEAAELARDAMYSTASVLYDADSYIASPRKQGAGLVNTFGAATIGLDSAYLTEPLQELGDDPLKTGVYTMSLELKNAQDFDLTYGNLETVVMFDYLIDDGNGVLVNSMTSDYLYYFDEDLNANYNLQGLVDVTYSINGEEVTDFIVEANSSVVVDVTITLSDYAKQYLDTYYPNGTFIEGYVYFNEYRDGYIYMNSHATYLAYYGDWTQAPVLEEADFRDVVEADYWLKTHVGDELGNSYYDLGYDWSNSGLVNFYTSPNMAFTADSSLSMVFAYAGDTMLAGANPYYESHIAFSTPLSNSTFHYADAIYMEPYQLRNAESVTMTVYNKETGEIYYVDETHYARKAMFDMDYGVWRPTSYFAWYGTDMSGNYVPSGTVATISYSAVLPYGHTLQEDIWSFDVTVDYVGPVIEDVVWDKEAGTLTVTASDDQYLQAIYLADQYYHIISYETFSSDVKGESFTAVFDVSGLTNFYVTALDYASNEEEKWTTLMDDIGAPATLTFHTPYGTEVKEAIVGEAFFFEEAESPEGYEFMFWAPQRVEPCSEDEVWDVPEPWWFGGDAMTVAQTEYEFYALYAAIDVAPLEKANYWYNTPEIFSGQWALCGWNLDEEGDFDVTNPLVMDSEGNTLVVADFADAEIGDYYVEFYTNEPGISFTVEQVFEGDNVYTMRNDLTGQYLAMDEDYNMIFVDEEDVDEYAMWYLYDSYIGIGVSAWNYGDDYAVLVYNDEEGEFQILDDSEPYIDDYYPSEYFILPMYQCDTVAETVLYYTTEVTMDCDHENTEVRDAVEATCTEDGYTGDTYCTDCGEKIADGEVIPATGHTEGEVVVENEVDATCTEDGSYDEVIYCTECGEELSRETVTVPAPGHTEGEAVIENEKAPTCTEAGSYDEVIYCTECGEELSRETVTVPATGHNFGDDNVCDDCGFEEENPETGENFVMVFLLVLMSAAVLSVSIVTLKKRT